MKNPSFIPAIAALALLAACGQPAAKQAEAKLEPAPNVPMKDFFRNPEKSGFRISADGQYFGFRAPWHNRMNLFVQKVGDSTATQVTTDTVRDIGGYFWKGDRLVYGRDINGDENYIVFSASIDGKDVKALTPEKGVRAEVLDDLHGVEGMESTIMVAMNKRNPQVFDPWYVNIATGEMKQALDNAPNYESYVTDHTGVIRIASKTDGVNTTYYHRGSDKEPFAEYMSVSFKDAWQPMFFTFDNKNLYVNSNLNGRDKSVIAEWDIAGKKEVKEIASSPDYDMGGLDFSRKRKVITIASYTGARQEEIFLDDQTKALYDKLKAQLPGYELGLASMNDAEDKYTVWIGSDRVTGRFYYYDQAADKLTLLADRTPWLKESDMAEIKPIEYTSRDGMKIQGYLTLPKGREAKNLPVVINPHGGPWARDQWGFNNEVQFLANRGYAVLQMNFRGSTGYGRKHWEASFKQWGKTMQNDISDGVEWLVKQGIADPKRVAIYGASYGGYATLAGITYTPELYACGVDYVGVSNMFTFMTTIPPYWEPGRKMFYEMVGDPVADSVMMREASPVFFVDRIKCPLFIAQGANDPRVNKAESDQVVEALKKRGIEVEYMVKDNEGHGFHNEENRFDFYNAMEKFLDKCIGSGYKAATEEQKKAA
jgi:dipeptidyl aminopeptidase/acylaminoacyl peptidase